MKLEVEILQQEYGNVLSGYAVLFSFRLLNLCVKSQPAILLPAAVQVKGMQQTIEDVAKVGVRSEKLLDIYPFHEDLITPIGRAVAEIHPELKQTIKTVPTEEQDKEFKYLQLTMPEVDDNRYKILMDGVDTFYDAAKAQIDAAKTKYVASMEKEMFGQPKDAIDEARQAFDSLYNQHMDMIGKTADDKRKEIDEANQQYKEQQAQKEQSQLEQMAAQGTDVVNQIKIPGA